MMRLNVALYVCCLALWAEAARAARARRSAERPVSKVVRLLQDMKSELEAAVADDAAVHKELDCWCTTNEKEKTTSIAAAEKRIAELEASMGEAAAKIKQLTAEHNETRDKLYADQKSLTTAQNERMKESKAYQAESTDMLETIKAMEGAITALSKHHPDKTNRGSDTNSVERAQASFGTESHEASVNEVALLTKSVNALLSHKKITGSIRAQLTQLIRKPSSAFLQQPSYGVSSSYSSQSGQIFGILKQMKDDFTRDLSEADAAEKKAAEEFAQLKEAKKAEIAAGEAKMVDLKEQIGVLKAQHADDAKELAQTEEQLANDQTFLASLKEKCAESDAEFARRTKSRNDEIAAVADTIAILNADDSFDNFDKTVSAKSGEGSDLYFVQVGMTTQNKEKVVSILERAGRKNPQVALIATYAKLDAFTKVKKAISDMVAELKVQLKDEVAHRDQCIDDLAVNDRARAKTNDELDNLAALIASLESDIKALTTSLKEKNDAIAEGTKQANRASDDRAKENADFQTEIKDQRMTQMILEKALARMSQVYAFMQQPGAAHTQTSATKTDPGNGPARFTKYEQNVGGNKVVALLKSVIADSEATETELLRDERASQLSYEGFMKDTSKSIKLLQEQIVAATETKAKKEGKLSDSKTAQINAVKTLEDLHEENGAIHGACDFVLKNFEDRQAARTAEIDALNEAMGILSGMK